ncbi:MAG TPA: hypothetical protein VJR95_09800 [Rhodanobacter sp.]|nr:hypothetical protein [Rhodanobacter sp.]
MIAKIKRAAIHGRTLQMDLAIVLDREDQKKTRRAAGSRLA